LVAAVLTGTLDRSRVYRSWRTSSVDVRAADGQPIWLSTDGEVATAESGFVHGKHLHKLMVYRRQGPLHAGHADVPDDALRVGHGHYPSSSARSVMNFARHFTTAMLPGPAAPLIPYSDG
jgi:hypothetical protein